MFSKLALAATFVLLGQSAVSASPAPVERSGQLDKRFNVLTGQWDTENLGNGQFTLYNNLWGRERRLPALKLPKLCLTTEEMWAGRLNIAGLEVTVRSKAVNANVALLKGLGKQISSIKSIPTAWKWTYSAASQGLIADVSYDLWLSNVPNGTGHSTTTSTYEIMIWVSNRNAGPAGVQIATVTVGGKSWKLFKGTVETWTVFSFVASSELTNYSADLKEFLTYLSSKQGVSTSQYLVAAQAGTEPFEGSATLTTTGYTISIN